MILLSHKSSYYVQLYSHIQFFYVVIVAKCIVKS